MQWIRSFLAGGLALAGLLFFTGCTSVEHKARDKDLLSLFGGDPSVTGACTNYTVDRIEHDYAALMALSAELDDLTAEMAALKRTLDHNAEPYLSEQQNKDIELLLFRYTGVRESLCDMVDFYRNSRSADPDTHTKGAVLGMYAGLKISSGSSYFSALFFDRKDLIDQLNSAHPSYDISAGTYDRIAYSVTSIDNLELIDIAWYLFSKELATPESGVSRVRETDPVFAALIAQMDRLHAATHIQTGYLLHASRSPFPELKNRLEHSRIAALGDDVEKDFDDGVTDSRGFVFKNVARIKSPTAHILEFSAEQAGQIKALLKPGDVLLTYTAGYMSDVFLPGNFKHGITYIGTVEQRRQAGLTDELLMKRAISNEQGRELIEHVNTVKTADGYDVNIVEAVAEGVILNSLDKLLDTHINRLVVIRPVISNQERLDQLVLLMKYVGAPYDFKFDFQDDAYQCCTEVVYRTTNRKGSIDFSLVKLRGLWILAADDILRYYLVENPAGFNFVLLADQSPDADDLNAVIRTGPAGLQALYTLMDLQPPKP